MRIDIVDNPANFDPIKLLAYGWLGFGVILVGFAYWILRKEQDKPKEEQSARILYSLYAFMAFSVFIGFMGYLYEMNKPRDGDSPKIAELEKKIEMLTGELKDRDVTIAKYQQREKEYIRNWEAGRNAAKTVVAGFPLISDNLEKKLLEYLDKHFNPRIVNEGIPISH